MASDVLHAHVLDEDLVHQHGGRAAARTDALDLDERELVVAGGLADLNAQVLAERAGDFFVPADFTRDAAADGDQVLAAGPQPELLVERSRVEHVRGWHLQKRRDLLHRLERHPRVLVLDHAQRGQHRRQRAFVTRQVDLGEFLPHGLRQVRRVTPLDLHRARSLGGP